MKYVLMIWDDHSDYKRVFPFLNTAGENAAVALIDWRAAFGIPKRLMSNGPTHFRNETLRLLAKGLKTPHHFTLPYFPWSYGAVERLFQGLIRVICAIVSELQLGFIEWLNILPMLRSALSNAPSLQRGNISPFKAFTGMVPTHFRSTLLSEPKRLNL